MEIDKFPKENLVCVEWEDACSIGGWYDNDKPDKTHCVALARTYGQLNRKTKNHVLVVGMCFDDGGTKCVHTIPRRAIRSITKLYRSHT